MPNIVFECPTCGGHKYGDVIADVGDVGQRFCVNVLPNGPCPFKWEPKDDWKCFFLTMKFRNPVEFEAARRVEQGFALLDMFRGRSTKEGT